MFLQNLLSWRFLIFILTFIEFKQVCAQCNPAPGETCEDAGFFCSLDEMNGYSCTNSSMTEGNCQPRCAACQFPYCPPYPLRTWWSFVSQGGNISITLNVGTCNCLDTCKFGMVMGIWGDCHCGDIVKCSANCTLPNTSTTYQVNLQPCKIYYLSLDECCDCVCDFTLNTSIGGGPPTLTLGDINSIPSGIIQPVCKGFCGYHFTVKAQSSCLAPDYIWTLDGLDLGKNKSDIDLDFPDEGDFVLCVSAYLGNPQSNCKAGPKCATVKVRALGDRMGGPKTICYGYQWHTQYIYTSGTYHEQFTNNNCCKYDSVVKFTVLPDAETSDVFYIGCDNKPFIDILGRSYSLCKNNLLINLPNTTIPYKCDSAIRLTAIGLNDSIHWVAKCTNDKVELSPNFNIINKCGFGETYDYSYRWYKKNDTLQKTISTLETIQVEPLNQDYCIEVKIKVRLGADSAFCVKTYCDTINEADSKNTSENISLQFCDSTSINGQFYNQSTQFTQQLKNVFGCDSIINTELKISKSRTTNIVQSGCDSIIINNKVYYQSGIYSQTLLSSENCDSILNINLTIGKTNKVDLKMSACDSFVINGKTYYQSGLYPEFFQNINSCDSIVNLNLTIFKTQRDSLSFSDCDTVNYKGKIYTKTGDYPEYYIGANGCDSMVNIHINITNSNTSPLKLAKCDSVTINGTFYNQSGSYTQKLISANGCDSTLNIDLTIGKKSSFSYKLTSCDSALINGKWYLQSGNYTQLLQNTNQCDSTLNIDLNITKSTSGDTLFRSCDSVIINGVTYRQTGIYQQTLTNSNLCDSLLIIDFIRLSKTSTALSFRSCDSVVVNNQVFTQSGNYTQTFVNANQCDSILNLNVTIIKSNSSNSSLSACDSLSLNGQTYYQSGNYKQNLTNADHCDSTLNLNLSIYKSSSINYALKSCDSANINGQIYKQSGNYKQYLKDVHLCDSTANLSLTINSSIKSVLSQNACDSLDVNGIRYFTSGQYKQKLITNDGCDSTLTLDLIIKPGNPSLLDAGADTSICEGEIIKLNGIFSGIANFTWHSKNGILVNPNNLSTDYYSTIIGDERIYLQAADDCKQWLDSLAVHVLPRQIVQVTGDTLINPCKEISFTASGGTNYIWTPSSYIECLDPPCSRVILKSTVATRFTISTDGPCAVPANLNLSLALIQTEVWLPNAFSPNGDNINDVFLPVFNCEQVDYFNLQIFDRWGNLIFESQNKEKGWDGKYQDQKMNPGVYPYVFQYQLHEGKKRIKAGDVTLLR